MTEEDLERTRAAHEREAQNPYSKDKMQEYLRQVMGDRTEISSEELPMESRRDLLCALSAVAYGEENGYLVQAKEGYVETEDLLLRRFTIEKEKKEWK